MNIAMTIFAFIGIVCVGCFGIFMAAIAWYNIREKWEEKRKKNG